MLRSLTDRLVGDLIPSLDADEVTVYPYLGAASQVAIDADHRTVRALTERLESIVDVVERRRGQGTGSQVVRRALSETVAALRSLVEHERAVRRELESALPSAELERIDQARRVAITAARERTMLVLVPAVPSTSSTVLRRRPDLVEARAISLAAASRKREATPRAPGRPDDR